MTEEHRKAYWKAYRLKNKERIRFLQRRWEQNNPDKLAANYQKHRARILAYHRKYYKENGALVRAKNLLHSQQKQNKDKRRARDLQQKYGLTSENYNQLVDSQNQKCKICQDIPTKLYVDHCHISNKVRGLLCGSCNTGLGHFRDNRKILKAAIRYLQEGSYDIVI